MVIGIAMIYALVVVLLSLLIWDFERARRQQQLRR